MNNDLLNDYGILNVLHGLKTSQMLHADDLSNLAKLIKSSWGREALCAFLSPDASEFVPFKKQIDSRTVFQCN